MATERTELRPILRMMWACGEALQWLSDKDFETFDEAWRRCPEAHWMVWLVGHAIDIRADRPNWCAAPSYESDKEIIAKLREHGVKIRYYDFGDGHRKVTPALVRRIWSADFVAFALLKKRLKKLEELKKYQPVLFHEARQREYDRLTAFMEAAAKRAGT